MISAEPGKPQFVPQKQPQIDIAEASESLDAYAMDIDRGPRWGVFPLLKQFRSR